MSFNLSFSVGYLTQTPIFQIKGLADSSQLSGSGTSKNIKVTLYPRWYKHIAIEWSIPADWGNCVFNVYFSPSVNGPYTKLNNTPINSNHLSDIDTREYSRFTKAFYIVEAILLDKGNATLMSTPTTWETSQNKFVQLRAQEVQRREYLLLRKFTGVKSYLFRRKTYGERCPECWNPNVEKSMKDNCKTCLGTSFKGGFFDCYPIFIQYDPSNDSVIKTYFGKFEPNQMGAWTISVPEIYPEDIIIRQGSWDIWKVENTAQTELQSNTVRQMLQLTGLPKNSIEYELIGRGIPQFPEEYV